MLTSYKVSSHSSPRFLSSPHTHLYTGLHRIHSFSTTSNALYLIPTYLIINPTIKMRSFAVVAGFAAAANAMAYGYPAQNTTSVPSYPAVSTPAGYVAVSSAAGYPAYTTTTVKGLTTVCNGPTTISVGTKTYTVTKATTLVDNDCTYTTTVPVKPTPTPVKPSTAPVVPVYSTAPVVPYPSKVCSNLLIQNEPLLTCIRTELLPPTLLALLPPAAPSPLLPSSPALLPRLVPLCSPSSVPSLLSCKQLSRMIRPRKAIVMRSLIYLSSAFFGGMGSHG